MAELLPSQELELQQLVAAFPATLDTAIADWAKFKAGADRKLFTRDEKKRILDWYSEFPKLWETIKPNFEVVPGSYGMISTHKYETKQKAQAFVDKLTGEVADQQQQLGIAFIVIAGILIAAAFGVAGAAWAIGYMQKQKNISRMIDEVTAGNLPADVLKDAVEKENAGLFSGITDMIKLGLGAAVLYLALAWPLLRGLSEKASHAKS